MALTPKQLAELKKKFEEDDKKNDDTLAKAAEALKHAQTLKQAAKQTKTELAQETD